MKIKFDVKPYNVDRRTADLIARGDYITTQLFCARVRQNPKELERLERERLRVDPPLSFLLNQQAG